MQDNCKPGATREQRAEMLRGQGLNESVIKLCLDAKEYSEPEMSRTPIQVPDIKQAVIVPRPAESDDRRRNAFFGGTTIKSIKV